MPILKRFGVPRTPKATIAIAAAVAIGCSAAMAQAENPFVSAAQAPGLTPPPPLPPVQKASGGGVPPPTMGRDAGGSQGGIGGRDAAKIAMPKQAGGGGGALPSIPPAPPPPQVQAVTPAFKFPPPPAANNIYLPSAPPVDGSAPDIVSGAAVPKIDRAALLKDTIAIEGEEFTAERGKTYRLTASTAAPNLIISPFDGPKLITTSDNALRFVAHGKNLVVTVASSGPVGAYITGKNPEDPLVAVVFDPKPIPPRNYTMNVDGVIVKQKGAKVASGKDGQKTASSAVRGNSAEHTQRVVGLVQQVLMERVPEGFGEVPSKQWPESRSQAGIVAQPIAVLSSGEETLTTLFVTNTNAHAVQVEENDFYGPGVEAVLLEPHREIGPGEAIRAIVLRRVDESQSPQTLMSITRQ